MENGGADARDARRRRKGCDMLRSTGKRSGGDEGEGPRIRLRGVRAGGEGC